MKKTTTPKQGFTLIEVLVVATIIIVLAAIGFASYTSAMRGARDGKRKSDMESVRQALVLQKQQTANGMYHADATWAALMTDLVATGHMSQPTPDDPKTPGAYYYNRTGTGYSFCMCAPVENPTANGNSTSNACAFAAPSASTTYYCVTNP